MSFLKPGEIEGRVLYKDQDVIVLNKPSGLAVHAGPNSPDHLELYLPELCYGWATPPRLAHRLDRDTSGCLALGRHDKSIKRLGKMFMAGRIGKAYWAVVHGDLAQDQGVIDLPILKLTGKGGWRIVIDPAGQQAITEYRVLGRGNGFTWVECVPKTGRTHQIRVHMKAIGHPLRGDCYYGPDPESTMGLHLHSRMISLPPLSAAKPAILVEAPPPAHMQAMLAECGFQG